MGNVSQDRLKLLEHAIKNINNDSRFKGVDRLVAKLSDRPMNVETVSTGSFVLDQILGGGFGKGRIVEMYGPESSGKSSIALTAVGNVQKAGGTAVFIDAENALDPVYASKLGVTIDDLFVAQPNSAEQSLDLLHALVETQAADIVVVDSVAALVPQAELEGGASDVTIGLLARLMSKALRKLVGATNKSGTIVIFINQTRDKIGGFSPVGVPQTTPGGQALKFYASQRVEIRRAGQVKDDDTKEIIGNEVKFKVVKNKIAPPFKTGTSILTFNRGINMPAELIEVGKDYGVIHMPNSRTYQVLNENGEIFGKSKAEALRSLDTRPDLVETLAKAIRDKQSEDAYGIKTDNAVSDSDQEDDVI